MSIGNPLTDPLSNKEEQYQSAQMDLIRAIAEEEEKLRKQKELRDTEARGKEKDEE